MTRITVSRDIGCNPKEFWKLFLDDDFMRHLFEHLRFTSYEISERREEADGIFRRSRGEPQLDAPAVVKKVLGPKFAYVEEGHWNRNSGSWKWTMTPGVLADRSRMEGVLRIEDLGDSRCRMNVDASVNVRLLGIGALLEATAERSIRDGWTRTADYFNEYLRRPERAAV